LRVTISGEIELNHIQLTKLPFLPEFSVSYIGMSTGPQLTGNMVAVSMTWPYELTPRKPGQYTFPKISIAYKDNINTTVIIQILVLMSSEMPNPDESLPESYAAHC